MIKPNTTLPYLSFKLVGIVLGACLLLTSYKAYSETTTPLQTWQNIDYIQKAFNEIALKNEYKKTKRRIVKWQQPIHYQFQYHQIKQNPLVENLFKIHLSHLADITQHTIIQSKINSNLTIHLTTDKNYGHVIKSNTQSTVKNIERDSNCMGFFTTNKHNEIIQAHIVIPVDHAFSKGLLVACVVEETTQVMGLPNDSDWVNPSIANDASKIELLTGLDYILLKTLYQPKLKAGMAFDKSQPVIRKRLKALWRTKQIQGANLIVNSKGLYPFVN